MNALSTALAQPSNATSLLGFGWSSRRRQEECYEIARETALALRRFLLPDWVALHRLWGITYQSQQAIDEALHARASSTSQRIMICVHNYTLLSM